MIGRIVGYLWKRAIFDECDEIVEEMLFAEVGVCRICIFFDGEFGELWEVSSISISWMSETLGGSNLFGKVRWTEVRRICIGKHIMGSILLQKGDR